RPQWRRIRSNRTTSRRWTCSIFKRRPSFSFAKRPKCSLRSLKFSVSWSSARTPPILSSLPPSPPTLGRERTYARPARCCELLALFSSNGSNLPIVSDFLT
ncbi:hypothetical protein PENTCL1PPCAC_27867, partial [Pristionchus entomophagus]